MKFYIAGKITGNPEYKEQFAAAADKLTQEGHSIMNPAHMGPGFEHQEYMHVCLAMIDVCEAVALLPNWEDSKGARDEHQYARTRGKLLHFLPEDDLTLGGGQAHE